MHCHLHRGDWNFHLTNEKKKKKIPESHGLDSGAVPLGPRGCMLWFCCCCCCLWGRGVGFLFVFCLFGFFFFFFFFFFCFGAYCPDKMLFDLKDGSAQTVARTATVRYKLYIKLAASTIHSIQTPGQPVPALTLQRQVPGRVPTGVPVFKSLL